METDFAGLRKHDLKQVSTSRLPMPSGWACGEPVFVPAPKSANEFTTEDNGHLITLAQPESGKPAELWIVDAKSFDKEPVARIHLPRRVPAGFHGIFVPAKDLN
jgi:carotenoid cleavage dioxygenase